MLTVAGNQGFAGNIIYASMVEDISKGFAVAGGDGGHLAALNYGGPGDAGIYLPFLHSHDQVVTWLHNSMALLTTPAKELTTRYYDERPKRSYHWGCSSGGAQGFALAQYHPELFDGVFAGSPGNYWSHLALSFLWAYQVTNYGKT